MNIYIVTEGIAEKIVFQSWIPLINPSLSYTTYLDDVTDDNFYIISGMGYPYYFDILDNAIQDVNNLGRFDRLVVSVDSEEMTKQQKYDEISEFVSKLNCIAEIRVIIQHFCFETWALGNRRLFRNNPSLSKLREYKTLFNVKIKDPELLPSKPDEELNRAQFAEKYLRLALNDRFRNLSYFKSNPKALLHTTYFTQIKNRLNDTGHISSFDDFLNAFIP
jgi:hypothetical protein